MDLQHVKIVKINSSPIWKPREADEREMGDGLEHCLCKSVNPTFAIYGAHNCSSATLIITVNEDHNNTVVDHNNLQHVYTAIFKVKEIPAPRDVSKSQLNL